MPPVKPKRLKLTLPPGQRTLLSCGIKGTSEGRNEVCEANIEGATAAPEIEISDQTETGGIDHENEGSGTHTGSSKTSQATEAEDLESTCNSASTSKRKFHPRWLKVWEWLSFDSGQNLMFCKLCISKGKSNAFTQGCETFKTSSFTRHENSTDHQDCIKGIELRKDMHVAMSNAMSERNVAVMKAMQTVHWLAVENIALSKYESMMGFLQNIGVSGLKQLETGERVDYQSYYSANEFLEAISDFLDKKTTEKIQKSPVVTVFADESTDIANKKRMTLLARIIETENCKPLTIFLRDVEYDSGSGEGLTYEIIRELRLRNIPMQSVLGFGSDGASVMTGLDKGVSGRLKELNPHMINIHCMAHRLALCTAQAADGIPALKRYQEFMTSLFYYFKSSADREKELHKVQALLDHPKLKYKEIHAVRWLSFYDGLETIFRTLDPLISYFTNREAKKDPKAKGLLSQMATTQFIYITYLMMDVLPIVMRLCLIFQKDDLDVARAKVCHTVNHTTNLFKDSL